MDYCLEHTYWCRLADTNFVLSKTFSDDIIQICFLECQSRVCMDTCTYFIKIILMNTLKRYITYNWGHMINIRIPQYYNVVNKVRKFKLKSQLYKVS